MHSGFGRDYSPSEHPKIDFDELFNQPSFNAIQLLNTDHINDELRRNNQQITQKLVEYPEILKQIFDICFKPDKFADPTANKINNKVTYTAIEILSNMSQQFNEFLVATNKSTEFNPKDQEDVITEQIFPTFHPNQVFLYLFSLLDQDGALQETPLAYFSKIIVNLCYQKPKEMIGFFTAPETRQYAGKLCKHCYSKSIMDIITRLLEIEDSSSFLENEKLQILLSYQNSIQSEGQVNIIKDKLQNYSALLQVLLQKIDDRFQKSKFASLVTQLFSSKTTTDFLIHILQTYPTDSQIHTLILTALNKYLQFSTGNRNQNSATKTQNRLFDDNIQNSIEEIKFSAVFVQNILEIFVRFREGFYDENSDKMFVMGYLMVIRSLMNVERDAVMEEIVQVGFINRVLECGKKYSNNNMLHNLIKDILVKCIIHEYKKIVPLLLNSNQCEFLNLALRITSKNSCYPFQNQIFRIFQTIVKQSEQNQQLELLSEKYPYFAEILVKAKQKEQFYAFKAGGGYRKESSCWGDSSSEIIFDRILLYSDKKQGQKIEENPSYIEKQQEHWFDCGGLPLDSDSENDCSNSQDLQLHTDSVRSPFSKQGIQLIQSLQLNPKNSQLFLQSNQSVDPDPDPDFQNFSQHFSSYISYDVDSLLSQLQ